MWRRLLFSGDAGARTSPGSPLIRPLLAVVLAVALVGAGTGCGAKLKNRSGHSAATTSAGERAEEAEQKRAENDEASKDREVLTAGRIHLAPGDWHLLVERGRGGLMARLSSDPPENFCRPSVDPMLRSLAQVYGRNLLCTILTGMGHDGLGGCRAGPGCIRWIASWKNPRPRWPSKNSSCPACAPAITYVFSACTF